MDITLNRFSNLPLLVSLSRGNWTCASESSVSSKFSVKSRYPCDETGKSTKNRLHRFGF